MARMKGLHLWPIVVGVLIEAAGGLTLGIAYVTAVFLLQPVRGSSMELSDRTLVVIETVGLAAAVLGGFVAARLAASRHVQHGCAVGIVAFAIWLAAELLFPGEGPPSYGALISLVAIVPAGALGGYLAQRVYGTRTDHTRTT
jgi:putative membrane protein (TIGR04086 family)